MAHEKSNLKKSGVAAEPDANELYKVAEVAKSAADKPSVKTEAIGELKEQRLIGHFF